MLKYKVTTDKGHFFIMADDDHDAAIEAEEECAKVNEKLVDVESFDLDDNGLDGDALMWL
tara:strand:+ start:253 stop:432 length:180 start_codon:yes stop_codon:yes gene_type:complete